jgi:hypothetical protein
MPDDPKYMAEFKVFTRSNPTIDDLEALERELYGTNDRAAAVLLGAFLEESFKRFLTTRLRSNLNSEQRKMLFEHRGPLGVFSSQIAVAYAMGTIGPITRNDLDLIREVRNGAAHSRKHFRFDHPKVAAVCSHLKSPDLPGSFIPHSFLERVDNSELEAASDINNPRTRYHTAVHTLAHRMLKARNTNAFLEIIEGLTPDGLP